MFLLGYAYQLGHVPIGSAAIEQAIELNGAAVEMSRNAFRFGRLAAREPGGDRPRSSAPDTHQRRPSRRRWTSIVAFRADQLAEYQDAALAERYRARVARMAEIERSKAPGRTGLAEAVARGYYKLLAYKDEYEVARLYASPAFEKALGEQFECAPQTRVPPGAAAAGAPRQGHRRAAQDALRRLDAARVPPAGEGQGPARHGAGRVRLLGRAQARAADDRRLREAAWTRSPSG